MGEKGNSWKLDINWGLEIDPINLTSPHPKTYLNLNLNLRMHLKLESSMWFVSDSGMGETIGKED